jgi:hypothetical protein
MKQWIKPLLGYLNESLDSESCKKMNTFIKEYLGKKIQLHDKSHEIIETDCFNGIYNKKETHFVKFILKNDSGKELDDLRYDILNDRWILKGHDIYKISMPQKSFHFLEKLAKKVSKKWSDLEELENPLDSSLDPKAFKIEKETN